MNEDEKLQKKYKAILPALNERQKRLFLAAEAEYFGYGGISKVSRISEYSRPTIIRGMKESKHDGELSERVRISGGGRKKLIEHYPGIWDELKVILEPSLRGEPESPLSWTSKSLRNISSELRAKGYDISHRVIGDILKSNDFSLQANRKTHEGISHPDRDKQFRYINRKVIEFQNKGQPVISVDAKKKELIGNFKNEGREWKQKGNADRVNVYDFLSESEGKGIPYGVLDMTTNKGWVNVGVDKDTSEFAVQTIRNWWNKMGSEIYNNAKRLLITADGGGSNGSRVRLWKYELQKLSDETGLIISVSHFPPATSKWNKIEHRMFSYITKNWRGRPLVSYEVMVNLIGSTKTEKGLEIKCELDTNTYETGKKISDDEYNKIKLKRYKFHGEWNYNISPNKIVKVIS